MMDGAPKFIMLADNDGYSFGVEARGKGWSRAELHGGFRTAEEAQSYGEALAAEYDDYEYIKVVKIETPGVWPHLIFEASAA